MSAHARHLAERERHHAPSLAPGLAGTRAGRTPAPQIGRVALHGRWLSTPPRSGRPGSFARSRGPWRATESGLGQDHGLAGSSAANRPNRVEDPSRRVVFVYLNVLDERGAPWRIDSRLSVYPAPRAGGSGCPARRSQHDVGVGLRDAGRIFSSVARLVISAIVPTRSRSGRWRCRSPSTIRRSHRGESRRGGESTSPSTM